MADVTVAFFFVMKNEDSTMSGVVTPEPKGGKARFGVNSIAHPEAVTAGFYEMSKVDALAYAKKLFQVDYWLGVRGNDIEDQFVANKIVDLAFNMNVGPAVMVVQRALNDLLGAQVLVVDGVMGTQTLTHLGTANQTEVLNAIRKWAIIHYTDIATRNPDEAKYLGNWIARAKR